MHICNNDFFILITFLQREIILLFPWFLSITTDDINKSTHGVSFLMVNSWAFHALLFLYFNIHEALQRVSSIV